MILSGFALRGKEGKNALDTIYYGEVTVTTVTGRLWWKKVTTRREKITRRYAGRWYFVENGEYLPGEAIDALERSYRAKTGEPELTP